MSALNRKLIRDLMKSKGQMGAIALVVACGVATFIMCLGTLGSLKVMQAEYYDEYRFAHVFTGLKRAPESLKDRFAKIPGVKRVQTRIVQYVNLQVDALPEPASGKLISIPEGGHPELNDLCLRSGRLPNPERRDEVLASEAFAQAHGYGPGATVTAILNGRRQKLIICGIVLSPEYVYQLKGIAMLPDDKRFGVFWMNRKGMEAAFDMEGAFNDVSLLLYPDANEKDVIRRLDLLTEPYGGAGAFGRKDQVSHSLLSGEIKQLGGMAMITPTIFLGVAVFMLQVVLSRLINVQREQIASLKAFGYYNRDIFFHYMKMAALVVLFGGVLGVLVGDYLGESLTKVYSNFYRFPNFRYVRDLRLPVCSGVLALTAALFGIYGTLRRAASCPPAEAMRPESPGVYTQSILERFGLQRFFSQPLRMALRQIQRKPVKALLSCLGIAFAVAIFIVGSYMIDTIHYLIDYQYAMRQRQDLDIAFHEPLPQRALGEIRHLPGVIHCEPFRTVPVKFSHLQYSRRGGILGIKADSSMMRFYDEKENLLTLPPDGIMISRKMADTLGVQVGDSLRVEVLEGERPKRNMMVSRIFTEYMGGSAYMELTALNHFLREGSSISGAYLNIDDGHREELFNLLKEIPRISDVNVKSAGINGFKDTLAKSILIIRFFNVIFASVIACGVVYNNARITLAEKSRELATMRVIGFTVPEISAVLLGEIALLTLVAIPFGLVLGFGMAAMSTQAYETEMYVFPLVVGRQTYGLAALVVLLATALSGYLVQRQLKNLDLIAVLKARD